MHELAHLKRGDLWVLAFQRLVQIAFFFNPSIWIANRGVDRLREYACDDAALVHSKIDRRSCGEGFLRVVERVHGHPVPGAAALALFERRSDSKRRLARILDSRRRLAGGLGLRGAVFLILLGIVLLPGLRAQEPDVVEVPAAVEPPDASGGNPAAGLAKKIARPGIKFGSWNQVELVNPPPGSPPGQGQILRDPKDLRKVPKIGEYVSPQNPVVILKVEAAKPEERPAPDSPDR